MTEPANPLNIRVSYSRAETRKQGDNYSKEIVTVESDKPTGIDVPGALDQLRQSVDNFFLASSKNEQQTQNPQQREVPISKAELDAIPFKQMPSKPNGFWAFTDKPESQKLVALLHASKDYSLTIGEFRYTLSKDGKFLNRWPHKKNGV